MQLPILWHEAYVKKKSHWHLSTPNAPRAACLCKKDLTGICRHPTHLVLLAYVAHVLNSLEAQGKQKSSFCGMLATNAPCAACLCSTRFEQFRGTRQAKKSFLMA
jgi:hypothetical protein